jgi:hypothetical protein
MTDFVFPSSVALAMASQELLPRMMAGRAGFDILPMRSVDQHLLEWEQIDNYVGLQQVRGLNGDPIRVKPVGGKRFAMVPGTYGEFKTIDELQLTTRRPWGTFAGSINVTDLVGPIQNELLGRRLDRIEFIIWTLLITGTFSVAEGSSVLHTDSYTTQTDSWSQWSSASAGTPLKDIRAAQLKARGYSVNFGASARLYMNQVTFNQLLANTNAADVGGRRVTGFNTINGPDQLNEVLSADNLPNIVIYDQGYLNDAGTFVPFIADSKILMVGARTDGAPVGEYLMTRNANNPNMEPGPYMKIVDDPLRVPRTIEVHDGHNGGPVLYHPAALVLATTT